MHSRWQRYDRRLAHTIFSAKCRNHEHHRRQNLPPRPARPDRRPNSSHSTANPSCVTNGSVPRKAGGGISRIIEGGRFARAWRRDVFSCDGQEACRLAPPPIAPKLQAAAWEAMGRLTRAAPEQPLRADGSHERALLSSRAPRSTANTTPSGSAAAWTLTPYYGFEEDCVALPPREQGRARSFRRRLLPALQEVVRRVFLFEAPQGTARHRRRVLRRLSTTPASINPSP